MISNLVLKRVSNLVLKNLVSSKVYNLVSKTFGIEKKVSDSASKVFGIKKSFGFGFVQILSIVTHCTGLILTIQSVGR